VPRAGGKCARGRRQSGKGARRGKGAEKGGVARQKGKGLTHGAHLESAPSESGREREEEGGRTWNPAPLPPACLIHDCESCLPPATVLGTSHLRPRILPPACDRARIFSAASSPLLDSCMYRCFPLSLLCSPPNPPVLFPLLYCFSSPSSTLFLSTRALLCSSLLFVVLSGIDSS